MDYDSAIYWNGKAADQDDANGELNLGRLYLDGLGTPKNPTEARRLIGLAAAQGNAEAKQLLSRLPQ